MRVLLVVMGVIGALALFLLLARRMGQRETKAVVEYVLKRGWVYLDANNPELLAHLDPAFPDEKWRVYHISAPLRSGSRTFLFAYDMSVRNSRDKGSGGYACLAQHVGQSVESLVLVTRRVPIIEKLVGDKVQLGGGEFRQECTVTCRRSDVAARVINRQVELLLLEHFKVREWVLDARFTGDKVVVMSHWAQSPEEWDYIIDLARKLADAIQ